MYKDIATHSELYDTSDYLKEDPLHNMVNNKVLGKMKDVFAGWPITEYVGLRPKMYSILEADGKNIKKAKGMKKCVVKKHIHHVQYKEALFDKKIFCHGMDVWHSEGHHIYGQHLNKVSLSPFDSKRYIASDGVHTLAYGHKEAVPAVWAQFDDLINKILLSM